MSAQFWADVDTQMQLPPAARWRGWTDTQVRYVAVDSARSEERESASAELERRADDEE